MKKYEFNIASREQFIEFAKNLGKALQQTPKELPWVLDLNGDGDSGKSLIALGIDSVFRPDTYPNGIAGGLSADEILKSTPDNPVVMNNFRRTVHVSKEDYDNKLTEYSDQNQQTAVLIAANLERVYVDKYYSYERNGLNSDMLDLGIQVFTLKPNTATEKLNGNFNTQMKDSSFHRNVVLYVDDDCPLIAKLDQIQSNPSSPENQGMSAFTM